MQYKVRSGIVYRKIAEEHFLIACGDAVRICPAIQQINPGAAYFWQLLEKETDSERVLSRAAEESGADKETLRPGLEQFLQALESRKYISSENSDD